MSAVQEIMERQFGGPVRHAISTVSVGTSATALVLDNPERVGLTLINVGVTQGVALPVPAVAFPEGILVGASGGALSLRADEDGPLSMLAWWADSDAAAGNWLVIEIIRVNPSGR